MDSQSYFSVGAENGANGSPSPNTLTLFALAPITSINILWGSIDSYNTIDFDLSSGSFSITGLAARTAINAARAANSEAAIGGSSTTGNFEIVGLFNFDFGADSIDSITFTSTQAALEFALQGPDANLEVPVPAALPLFGTGLLLMGFFGRRRRRGSAA